VLSLPLVAGVAVARRRFAARRRALVADLLADAEGHSDAFSSADAADLPAPVRRYLNGALTEGQTHASAVRLRQRGSLRLGDGERSWRSFTATQHVTTRPPGFVWDARVRLFGVPVRVVDRFRRGEGSLRARLLDVVPVATADPSPGMNEGELLRYLAEAVWYPTALLPGRGVEWEAVDDRSARATLESGGVTASVVFHFADGAVERVTADRYRREEGGHRAWTGRFSDYRERNGRRVPLRAAAAWDGDGPYWRATVTGIEHRDATPTDDGGSVDDR
jgi:hypothetical protein